MIYYDFECDNGKFNEVMQVYYFFNLTVLTKMREIYAEKITHTVCSSTKKLFLKKSSSISNIHHMLLFLST